MNDAAVGRSFEGLSEDGEDWSTQVRQALGLAAYGAAEFEAWLWQPGGARVCVSATVTRDGGQ